MSVWRKNDLVNLIINNNSILTFVPMRAQPVNITQMLVIQSWWISRW